jgi:hypothetical protein
MADTDKTPPVVTPPIDNNSDNKINELIQTQLQIFQKSLKKQLDDDYNNKLSKLQSSQSELEEKKQHLAIIDELKTANMDSSLIDFVYDKDIEISKVKIKQLSDLIKAEVQKGIEERLKQNVYIPPINHGDVDTRKPKPKYFI